MHVTMQYLIILFFKGTETPTNYIFGSIICQNALCCAICYTSIQIVNSRVWTFKILKQKINVMLETKPIFYRWETKIFEKNLSKIKISEYKSFFPMLNIFYKSIEIFFCILKRKTFSFELIEAPTKNTIQTK